MLIQEPLISGSQCWRKFCRILFSYSVEVLADDQECW